MTGLLVLVGAPAPYLLGPLGAGLVVALRDRAPDVPQAAGTASQGLIGVSVGVLVTPRVLATFADNALALVTALAATLAVSLGWGQLLRLQPEVSAVTATFASIAGGASGVVATAREAGADEPVVATIQYLRVLMVLAAMPVVGALIGPGEASAGGAGAAGAPAGAVAAGVDALSWSALGFTLVTLVLGLGLLRLRPFPGAAVLVPMLLAAGLAATGWFPTAAVPPPLLDVGYAVIGAQVGVKFTPATVRVVTRLLPLALVQIVGTILTCAGIGYLMGLASDISQVDAYLATTPGGLYAVVAVALSTGADSALVFTLQVLRLFAALLMVPLLARLFRDRPRGG